MHNKTLYPNRLTKLANQSIVLVGMMGAGKTSVAKILAQKLVMPFYDSDVEIETSATQSVTELFSQYGEKEFRNREEHIIKHLLLREPIVLAVGGGAFVNPIIRDIIKQKSISIWLRCPLDILFERISQCSHRPLLKGIDRKKVLQELIEKRSPAYAQADVTIECRNDTIDQISHEIMTKLAAHPHFPYSVTVQLPNRHYNVAIGLGVLQQTGRILSPILPQKRAVIITDDNVAPLYLEKLQSSLDNVGIRQYPIIIAAGEISKSLQTYEDVAIKILHHDIDRQTTMIALGGGVVGDLAGFLAATLLRGIPFVQIPTTLLAQIDSSIGGKTGINTPIGKNLLGAFHQPLAVIADISTLFTLSQRELKAGYAEIVKSSLINDISLFHWCEKHGKALLNKDPTFLSEAVNRFCQFKMNIICDDEKEEKTAGGRALLNLGHTFAHALEAELGYDGRLLHGEAVAIGLVKAFALSVSLNICPANDLERLRRHLDEIGLPTSLKKLNQPLSARRLMLHMQHDKKMTDDRLCFILVHGIGQAFSACDISMEAVQKILQEDGCQP